MALPLDTLDTLDADDDVDAHAPHRTADARHTTHATTERLMA
jgi:hypothetical protein